METLFNLYHILSPSHKEAKMSLYIQHHLKEIGVSFEVDKFGQVFSIKPGTPILSAHMDQVQKVAPSYIFSHENNIYGFHNHRQVGLGADDKNGIWIILKILQEIDQNTVSFIFSSGEEAGGMVGSVQLDKHPYCIVLDRKGSGDIIGVNNNYCCQDFQDQVSNVGKDFGYKPNTGLFSDANEISKHVPCVNISVGYYNAHTEYEYTSISELENALQFTKKMLADIERIDYSVPKKPTYSGFINSGIIRKDYESWWKSNYATSFEIDEVFPDLNEDDSLKTEIMACPPSVTIRGNCVFLTDDVMGIEDEKISSMIPKSGYILEIDRDYYLIIIENMCNNVYAYIEVDNVYEEIDCTMED